MTAQLSGRTALITGGTSGIGLASAQLFAKEGARVAVAGRHGAADVAAALGSGHLGIDCDVTSVPAIERMAETLKDAFGLLDIVFANAGTAFYKPLADWSEDDFDRMFAVNAKGQFFTVQKCAPLVREGGVIILTGSIAPMLGQKNIALYAASKAVSPSFAKSMSAELLERNIRVLCLTPGPTDTPIFEKGGLDKHAARDKLADIAERIPIGRVGTAEELAEAALFLASDRSRFMLGTELVMDGGKSQL